MISGELERSIAELADVVSRMSDLDRACELTCERLQAAMNGPIAILERSGPRWRLRSSTQPIDADSDPTDDTVAPAGTTLRELTARAASVQWAWVPLGAGEERIMLVSADWQQSNAAAPLEHTIRPLGYALEAVALRAKARVPARIVRETYAFSRRLARVKHGRLHDVIAGEMARATRANVAALALFLPADGYLRIVATVGYPRVLVEHVRVRPGEGVIGRVFGTRRPLLVSDIAQHPQLNRRRARYRTPSFIGVPLLWREEPLGVVCVADRADGASFEDIDLQLLRALGAPASIALAAQEVSERAEMLSEWATIDPLTDLFNRRYFRQRLEEEFHRARRYNLPLSLLLLDIDDFKSVNDRFGHPAGDTVLRALADLLRRNVRAFDVCCRYGGEEFVLVLPGSDAEDALSTARRVRQAVEAQRLPVRADEPPVGVTLSIGSITLRAGDTVDDFIGAADEALYEAKRCGKNQIRVATHR
jgi:diguanylate cyclase (GGDEF)-like protein